MEAVTSHLRSGAQISCGDSGCKFHNPIRTGRPDESSLRYLYKNYQCNAKKRSYQFQLTLDQFRDLTKGSCVYCGRGPSTEYLHKWVGIKLNSTKNRPYVYNGVDRVDNAEGYVVGNCVSCCKVCNIMKQGFSREDFLSHIRRIFWRNGGEDGTRDASA